MAEEGTLARLMLAPDAPLGHIPRADVEEAFRKAVACGAKIPLRALEGTPPAEGETVRVYLAGEFWGMAERREDVLAWRALIAPEAAP